jgi:DNA-binding transcriptional LysR family regulator
MIQARDLRFFVKIVGAGRLSRAATTLSTPTTTQ